MAPIEFDVNGFRLAGLAWGRGEPTLALHGWLDNAATWTELAPLMSGRVMSLDLRGHGHSDHTGRAYHIWDSVSDLFAVVKSVGQPVHLLGHSMGAGIATLFAGCFPEWTRSLNVVEGFGPWVEPSLDTPAQLRRAAQAHQANPRPARVYPSLELAAKIRAEKGVSPVSETAIFPVIERGMQAAPGGYQWRADPALRWPSPLKMTHQQVNECLQGIQCPVRIAVAEQGMLIDSAMLRRRLNQVSSAQVRNFKGDHHLHLYPEVAGAIATWFNEVY